MQKTAADIASNTANIAENTQILDHLLEVGKLYGWIGAIVIALLIYTWRQKEKTQDKLELVVTTHIKENDKAHGKVFDEIRSINHKVDTLIGEHNREMSGRE